MTRQNLFADAPWDVEDAGLAQPYLLAAGRREDGRARSDELEPGYDGDRVAHALRRRGDVLRPQRPRPVCRDSEGERSSPPATSCSVRKDARGLHAYQQPARRAGPDPRHERRRHIPRRRRLPGGRVRVGGDAGCPSSPPRRRSGHHRSGSPSGYWPYDLVATGSRRERQRDHERRAAARRRPASAVPPWASVTAATIESPRPTPPLARAREVSAR